MGNELKMIAGLDIGNGYVKGKLSVDGDKPRRVDLPSCVDYVNVGYKWLPAEPTDEYMDNLVNQLDCDVKTPALPEQDKRRILVGDRAAAVSNSLRVFNLNDSVVKCDNPLSVQLVLATIAAEAVRTYWFENKKLPDSSIQVKVDLGVALPFADYVSYRERYRNIFEGTRHTVHVHNFEEDVTVNIEFTSCTVLAEGAAAIYAIADLGPDFLNAALAASKEAGLVVDDSIDGDALIGYTNIVGIDVGEGTVNFPSFIESQISPEASSSINKGYGTVLENVMEATRNENFAVNSRKELEKLLRNDKPTPMQKAIQSKLQVLADDEIDIFARDVENEFKRVLAPLKLNTEAIYVFGGGASQIEDALYPRLLEAAKVADGVYVPVIYLDSSYSRDLNRTGLYQVAEIVSKDKK